MNILRYIWASSATLSAFLLLLIAWYSCSLIYSDSILPSPLQCLQTAWQLLNIPATWHSITTTLYRTMIGYGIAVVAGSIIGLLAGMSLFATRLSRPVMTILISAPPVAWMSLALIWFGIGHGTPVLTVVTACLPLVFVGALQGIQNRDPQLDMMATSLRLPFRQRLTDIYLPQVISYLIPAWITALGTGWKVVVMAELFANNGGIGAQMAVAQRQQDIQVILAWVLIMLLFLLTIEYLILEPIKRYTEKWREAA